MIPLSEQYRINIKNAIELIDNTLKLVKDSKKKWNEYDRSSDFLQTGNGFLDFNIKTLEDIRKEIAKKTLPKVTLILHSLSFQTFYYLITCYFL